MNAVAVIGRTRETGILVDDPDRGGGAVQALGPGDDGAIELLDFAVVISDA